MNAPLIALPVLYNMAVSLCSWRISSKEYLRHVEDLSTPMAQWPDLELFVQSKSLPPVVKIPRPVLGVCLKTCLLAVSRGDSPCTGIQ
jgi:hypothetical protein